MSKNPYEIRMQVLEMAKQMLEVDWLAQKDKVMEQFYHDREYGQTKPVTVPSIASFPTAEDIVKKAQELYKFIETK